MVRSIRYLGDPGDELSGAPVVCEYKRSFLLLLSPQSTGNKNGQSDRLESCKSLQGRPRQEDASWKVMGSSPDAAKGFFHEISIGVYLIDHHFMAFIHFLSVNCTILYQ